MEGTHPWSSLGVPHAVPKGISSEWNLEYGFFAALGVSWFPEQLCGLSGRSSVVGDM